MGIDSAVDALTEEAARLTSNRPPPTLIRATQAFLACVRASDPVPASLFAALERLPPLAAAWLAITCGSAVEQGLPASVALDPLLGLLRRWLAALPDNTPNELGSDEDSPALADMLAGFPWLGQALVAHLARAPERRAELARDEDLLAALERGSAHTHAALWIHELLRRCSGPLVVLHVESRRALALRYANVGLCFHLFTLVQGAIGTRLPGGREPDPALIAAAMGGEPTRASDDAWWHYQDHTANHRDLMHSLWAECWVGDLPEIDGVRVLVLWPPIFGGRHWDSSFFGPALDAAPAQVVLEREHPADEVEAWFTRLGLPDVPAP